MSYIALTPEGGLLLIQEQKPRLTLAEHYMARMAEEDAKSEGEDKFVSPCPPPTPCESEILDCLIEECAEVIQRATKMKRFGVAEIQPGQDFSNLERLSQELGDLQAVVERAAQTGLVDIGVIEDSVPAKHKKLDKFLQNERSAA